MNEDAKRTLLRAIPHGVYVVTSGAGDAAHGFTATWLTQMSFKPPLVAIGVRRDSMAYTSITTTRALVVNFIPRDARPIAEAFFKPPVSAGGKLGDYPFRAGTITGAPVLEAGLGHVECRVVHVYDGGDHSVVIAEVVEASIQREGEAMRLSDTPWKYGG